MHQIDKTRKEPSSVRYAPNREQAANIFFYMKRLGITQQHIADRSGVSQQMVQKVIYGLKTSGRVQGTIAATLGFTSWSALTAGRKGVAA